MSAPKGRQAQPPGFYDDARARLQAEREATQKVTRELHEAIQEARDTLGEFERVRAGAEQWTRDLGEDLKSIVEELVNTRTREVNGHFRKLSGHVDREFARLQSKLEELTALVIAAEHEVVGLPDKQAVMEILMRRVAEVTRLKLDEQEFRNGVAELVAEELSGLLGDAKISRTFRTASGGQITVKRAEPGEQLGMYVNGQHVEGSG